MRDATYSSLTPLQQTLLDQAAAAMETAYNPYSRFFVGAALHSLDNQIITGSNVENAAYGSTICAERAAILRANAMGVRSFDSLAVIGRGVDFDTTQVSSPCGACRQMLYESSQIAGIPLEVIMSTTQKGKIIIATIDELLPLAFGPKDLGIDISQYR